MRRTAIVRDFATEWCIHVSPTSPSNQKGKPEVHSKVKSERNKSYASHPPRFPTLSLSLSLSRARARGMYAMHAVIGKGEATDQGRGAQLGEKESCNGPFFAMVLG
jgi:hypothetical protein